MTDIQTILAFLSIATTLNLALVVYSLQRPRISTTPPDLLFPVGVQMENFTGADRTGGLIEIHAGPTAFALIFLSKGCPKCVTAAPEAASVASQAAGRGVRLWVVTADQLTAADLGEDSGFDRYFLDVNSMVYGMLNPRRASPAYMFLSADMIAQATGFIGDADWQSFAAQLAEPS